MTDMYTMMGEGLITRVLSEGFMTFDEWAAHIRKGYDGQPPGQRSWVAIGEWLINAKENTSYASENVGYHMCTGNYERIYAKELGFVRNPASMAASVNDIEEGCLICGTPMPEGIKMVALMEKL